MAQTNSIDLERGSSQYASITDASQTGLDLTGDLTFEAWVNFESTNAAQLRPIIGKRNSTGNQRSYLWYLSGTNSLQLQTSSNGTSTNPDVVVSWTPALATWYHIAVTKSGTTVKFYVNGRQQGADQTLAASGIFDGTAPFEVGNFTDSGGDYFDGLLKDVRVFNDVRTATEIQSDAHTENVSDANLQGEWNFNNAYTDSSGNGNTLTGSGTPTFPTTIPWTATSQIDGSYLETNAQGYWTFDESSGNAVDSTANGNTLTNTGSTAFVAAKINNGADLESTSSQYFSIADASQTGLDFSDVFSFAGWVNFESLPTNGNTKTFISKRRASGNNRSYDFYMYNNAGTYQFGLLWQTDGITIGGNIFQNFASTPTTSTWYHIAVTKTGTTVTFYLNGVQNGDIASGSNGTVYNGTAPFEVSIYGDDLDYFDGIFDEWGVWNTQLSYGGILDLYNAGTGISWTAGAAPAVSRRNDLLLLNCG